MTQRDYVKFASLLRGEIALAKTLEQGTSSSSAIIGQAMYQQCVNITRSMADIFAQDNPRFKRDIFYEAAGLTLLDEFVNEDGSKSTFYG